LAISGMFIILFVMIRRLFDDFYTTGMRKVFQFLKSLILLPAHMPFSH
jgi:hypothetical protein